MAESKRDAGPVAGIGDRVLARITALGADADYPYQARTIKRLARARGACSASSARSPVAPACSIRSTASS